MNDPRLTDEPGRMAALNRFCVLDTCNEGQFDKITALVRSVLDVPIAAVSLVDVDRQWFKSMNGLDVTETPRDISFCTHTIMARVPLNVGDAHQDDRFRDNPLVTGDPHIRAYLGAPLKTPDGYNVGALCAIDRKPRLFSAAEETILGTFAALVVDELELRLLAHRDHLTGAMTRRAFLERMESHRLGQGRQPAAFAMFDIDHFKTINDRYGHPAGDEVLRAVAASVRDTLTQGDVLGRLGGEEFGIVLGGRDLGEAFDHVERVREGLTELRFDFDPALKVTASFGLVDLALPSCDTAIAEADAALYAAKRRGRNRTIATAMLLKAA